MELKVAKYHNAAGETDNKSILNSLDEALLGAKICAGGTMKVVIRKHELKQVLELIKRSDSSKKPSPRMHQVLPRVNMLSPSAEQRLNLLRWRKLSRGSGVSRGGIGSRMSRPWKPTLQSIPEE